MRRIISLVIMLFMLPVCAADWPEFMHDSSNSGFSDIDINARVLIWKQIAGDWFKSSPAVYEGMV
ncbi:MAG: hypothetical protein L6243_06970, partial [Candidatus Altiarchaeales archaeon]|nr:hypothetical protein [Candidatus Altiarchaeales archaeon]